MGFLGIIPAHFLEHQEGILRVIIETWELRQRGANWLDRPNQTLDFFRGLLSCSWPRKEVVSHLGYNPQLTGLRPQRGTYKWAITQVTNKLLSHPKRYPNIVENQRAFWPGLSTINPAHLPEGPGCIKGDHLWMGHWRTQLDFSGEPWTAEILSTQITPQFRG